MAPEATPKRDQCSCCFESRIDSGNLPRKLIELPTTTAGYNKRKQHISVYACEVCDGPPSMNNQPAKPGVIELANRSTK